MVVYLDSVIVIYFVERVPLFQPRAQARLAALRAAGDQIAVSDLTRLECRVKPIRTGDAAVLADFDNFFAAPDILNVPLPPAVYERATHIRARYNYKLADALHLAAAVESGCNRFLTNDHRLSAFPDIPVEVLP
jgi:predicted nucleic acid-binding protein